MRAPQYYVYLDYKQTEKSVFNKRYIAVWTDEIFPVDEIKLGKPTLYKLKDLNGEEKWNVL
jgi:hypothetical protein